MFNHHESAGGGGPRAGAIVPLASLVLEPSLADPHAALTAMEPLLQDVESARVIAPALAYFVPAAIECLINTGQLDRAARVLERFDGEARAERDIAIDRDWALVTSARCRCLLLAARGDLDAAEATAAESLHAHRHHRVPFERARTLLVQGQVRRRRREKRAAEESIVEALDTFETLGASQWAERARIELGRLGVRRGPGELTATEDHVARLAASGMSNKQVAASLFISPSTVKSNLAKIYCKLGVTGRAQLAMAMARRTDAADTEPDALSA